MVVGDPISGPDQRDIVDDRANVGKQLRDLCPGLSVLLEGVRAGHDGAWKSLPDHNFAEPAERLSVILLEQRLWIERVDVADSAGHEERDHCFGAGLEVRL